MFELSLHILDLVQNSITAGATLVRVIMSWQGDTLTIVIEDDGCGMDEAFLQRVTSPFTTTRTTRKVGLGIPMFKQLAEMCEGTFEIVSQKGEGTRLTATFRASHVDLPPVGDIAGTFLSLVSGAPDKPDFVLEYKKGDDAFVFDTREIRRAVGGISLSSPEILGWIHDYLSEGLRQVDGGKNA